MLNTISRHLCYLYGRVKLNLVVLVGLAALGLIGGLAIFMVEPSTMSTYFSLPLQRLKENTTLIALLSREKDVCKFWRAQHLTYQQSTEWWHALCAMEHEMMKIDYKCSDKRMMGNKNVCFDPGLIPKESCLVYSFGIDNDFSFDDAMAGRGCTVYSFDPSMTRVKEHKRSERVFFKKTGIAGKDDDHWSPRIDRYVRTPTTWRVRRLASIMKELGHVQGSLTILKMDIESSEWDVVDDILKTEGLFQSLPQLIIEWHLFTTAPPPSRYLELHSIFSRFLDTRFLEFHWNIEVRNHNIHSLRSQTETSWVNPRFLNSSQKRVYK